MIPQRTAAGIQAILTILRTRLPGTKILLVAVFPRRASADDPYRRVNAAINDRIRHYADNQQVSRTSADVFLTTGNVFFKTSCPITCTPVSTGTKCGPTEWRK